MTYKVSIANNLRALKPELPKYTTVESSCSLSVNDIAARLGIPHLLVVGGIIQGQLHPLDQPVEKDAAIVILGPVAGG